MTCLKIMNFWRFPLFLITNILIKIGQIPLFVFFTIIFLIKQLAKIKISVPTLPKFHFPSLKIPKLSFPKLKLSPVKKKRLPKKEEIKTESKFWHFLPRVVKLQTVLILFLIFIAIYSYILLKLAVQLPSPELLSVTPRPLTTQIFDRNGKLLFQFYEGQNRQPIDINTLPKYIPQSTIAIEDKHFYQHLGFDLEGILRAIKVNLTSEGLSMDGYQGGSTITQQLIKNTLLTPDKTFKRKIKEVILAFWAERLYSKDQILQMYLNEAPYGGPAWGIEAASQTYFGKQARDLNLAEATFLAGLPAAPTEYSPFGIYPEKGKERQAEVLRRMVEDGYITRQQNEEALKTDLQFKSQNLDIKAPHFVMYIRSLLAAKYGEKVVSQGGLKIITTLDLNLQDIAQEAVSNDIEKLRGFGVGNGAAMITNAKNGQILAMVGSKDYFEKGSGNFNVALAVRQPGSSIKPVTYVTGFEQGYTPGMTLLDSPTTFNQPGSKPYSPVNYDSRFHGPVSLRTALGSSYNVPAVKMLALVGLPAMIQTAKNLGITTFESSENYGLSLTLGGGGVRLIDMMTVYGTFAGEGIKHPSQAILMITDSYGNTLEDHRSDDGKQVIPSEAAYLISNILSDPTARAPAFGIGSLLEIPGHSVAAKTGTSDDKRDNWCFGYTPEYVVGVWVGNNDNSPMDPRLTSGITGATPIWHDIMTQVLEDKENQAFTKPAGIIETVIDGRRDLAISGIVPKSVIRFNRTKTKNEATGEEKETTAFSDQFSTFNPDKNKTTQ